MVAVSWCLCGRECRYDGTSKPDSQAIELMEKGAACICPEVMGGLQTPRAPAERVGDKVVCNNGHDVTAQYQRGAQEVLQLAKLFSCKLAILKANSPSCSHSKVYDGTFTRNLVDGMGVTAELLTENGIRVVDETEIFDL